MKQRLLFLSLVVMLLGLGVDGWGQIAQFNFPSSNSLVVSVKDINVTVTNMSLSTGTIETNITTGTYFPNEPYIEEAGGWTSTSQSSAKNFTFTITANSGYQFSITNISFRAYATSAGPSAFSFGIGSTDIYTVNAPDASLVTINQSVSDQTNLTTAVVKIQGWLNGSRTSAGSGTFRLDDVIVTGVVSSLGNSAPSLTTQLPSVILTTTATGNGNITSTGGVSPTTRGFCWDLAANADPDISDSKSEEGGTFTTGAFTGSISGLTAGTQYKIRAYATNTEGTGYGGVQNFYTFSTQPSAHAASFTSSAISQTQIDLTFSAASTITNAAGYIVLQRTGAAPTGAPADGSAYSVGNAIGDGTVAAVITNTASTTASITGLTAGTQYYFSIFPFNWDGATNATYNYKMDESVPGTNATTVAPLDVTSKVEAPTSQTSAGSISSTATTSGSAIEVFKFKISDLATSDAVATKVTQVRVQKSSGTADWTDHIAGAELWDGTSQITTGTVVITDSDITFPVSSGNLDIASGSSKDITLKIWLNTTNIVDNATMIFSVSQTSHGFTADASASTFAADFGAAVIGNTMTLSVEATKLKFVQQPSNTSPNVAMSPVVTVEATDANNNRDLDYITDINIISSGTLTGSPVAGTPASGLASFSTLTHTAIASNLTLTATSGSLIDATSNTFAISNVLLVEDFDYLDGELLTDKGWTAHSGSGTQAIDVTSAGLSFNGYVGSGIGGAARVDNNGEDINKTFTPKTAGSIYVAFIISANSTNSLGYFFHLAQDNISNSTFVSRVWINPSGNSVGIGTTPSVNITANTPTLLVVKYNIDTKMSSLYVLNTLSTTEPAIPDATYQESLTLTNVGAVCLRQYNASQNILVDGIRVTTSWSDLPITFSGTGEWTETARWNIGLVPATNQNVVIDGNATINSNENIEGISINSGKNLTINADKQLTVNGTLTNSGTLTIKSDASGTGSLIHSTAGVAATVERYIASHGSVATDGWHLIGSPVATFNIDGSSFDPGANDDIYAWNEATNTWLNHKAGDPTQIVAGTGYIVAYENTGAKNFSGNLNVANVSVSGLAHTAAQGKGWHLLGNPFASALEWNKTGGSWALTNVAGTAKVWNSTTKAYVDLSANGIIPAAQGFFVQVNEGTTGSLTIPAAARAHSSTAWYKNTAPRLILSASPIDGSSSQESQILIENEATNNFDFFYDARFLAGYAPQFYSLCGSEMLSTNVLSQVQNESSIPFGFVKNQHENFVIRLEENNLGQRVYIKDLKLNLTHNLSQQPDYYFTSTDGDNPNRFVLHFGAVGVSEQPASAALKAYVVGGQLYFPLQGEATLEIVDLQGRVLQQGKVSGQGLASQPLQLPAGAYVVRLTSGQNVQTAKVIVK